MSPPPSPRLLISGILWVGSPWQWHQAAEPTALNCSRATRTPGSESPGPAPRRYLIPTYSTLEDALQRHSPSRSAGSRHCALLRTLIKRNSAALSPGPVYAINFPEIHLQLDPRTRRVARCPTPPVIPRDSGEGSVKFKSPMAWTIGTCTYKVPEGTSNWPQ
ncbi:hypothetical protein M440DRAFT_313093 [Trichoderma longibrachiatum ATCC 18648]|uniref:Uncharacterized protein n=1 Tax=Trichoderma longibrachiatum ATCC 18648 TaxID=983965 RepID=A0A2T4C3B3_TRILO|nr:hypothetical protein M440DRAFT_313093 [Trichoderma longibrachiatum ATCC 18648]